MESYLIIVKYINLIKISEITLNMSKKLFKITNIVCDKTRLGLIG